MTVATSMETTTITTTGAGTVTVPNYTYEVEITAIAAGGGGGQSSTTGRGDTYGGGGASGSLIIKTLSVSEKEPISYDVGSGGGASISSSSSSTGGVGGNTEFTYNSITYVAIGGSGGGGADGSIYGVGGTASSPTDGDTNTIGNNGSNGGGYGGTSAGGVSVSSDGYGVGGDGSTTYPSQNSKSGGDGGLIFVFSIRIPEVTVPSDRVAVKKVVTIGGNKISLTEDTATAKSRIRATIVQSSIPLENTTTKIPIGGRPLELKKANNGNYVLHVYAIDDNTPAPYSPGSFEQATDPTMFRGVGVDVFKATDGNMVLAFDRLKNQDDLDDFGTLNSNETISNTIMWLGVPLIVDNEDVLLVSKSDESNVDEFVTTNFMGFPFLVARQGSNYLLCVLFDDYNLDVEDL